MLAPRPASRASSRSEKFSSFALARLLGSSPWSFMDPGAARQPPPASTLLGSCSRHRPMRALDRLDLVHERLCASLPGLQIHSPTLARVHGCARSRLLPRGQSAAITACSSSDAVSQRWAFAGGLMACVRPSADGIFVLAWQALLLVRRVTCCLIRASSASGPARDWARILEASMLAAIPAWSFCTRWPPRTTARLPWPWSFIGRGPDRATRSPSSAGLLKLFLRPALLCGELRADDNPASQAWMRRLLPCLGFRRTPRLTPR